MNGLRENGRLKDHLRSLNLFPTSQLSVSSAGAGFLFSDSQPTIMTKRHDYPTNREPRIVKGGRRAWINADKLTDARVESLKGILKQHLNVPASYTLIARAAIAAYAERLAGPLTKAEADRERLRILSCMSGTPEQQDETAQAMAVMERTGTKAPDSEPVKALVDALKALGVNAEVKLDHLPAGSPK
jgi:hypothetical protein